MHYWLARRSHPGTQYHAAIDLQADDLAAVIHADILEAAWRDLPAPLEQLHRLGPSQMGSIKAT